jgi:hypothetical protein
MTVVTWKTLNATLTLKPEHIRRSGCSHLNLQIRIAPDLKIASLQLDIDDKSKPVLGILNRHFELASVRVPVMLRKIFILNPPRRSLLFSRRFVS